MRPESDLVTGDAVVLDLRLARSASRALAYGIDVLVQVASLVIVLLVLTFTPTPSSTAFVVAVVTVVQMAVLIGYPTLLETLTRGRTLGKMALGLRVVREDGGPIRLRHALIRALAGAFVDFGPFGAWSFVGFLVSLSSAKGKRVGDYLAGTVVVRERVPRSTEVELAMPPELVPWASGLDLTGLPDDLALSARQYLGRYHELNASSRERVGDALAAEVAQCVNAPVPPGMPSWAYLSVVLAERRTREHARGQLAAPFPHPRSEPPGQPPRPPREPVTDPRAQKSGESSEAAQHTRDERNESGPFTPPA